MPVELSFEVTLTFTSGWDAAMAEQTATSLASLCLEHPNFESDDGITEQEKHELQEYHEDQLRGLQMLLAEVLSNGRAWTTRYQVCPSWMLQVFSSLASMDPSLAFHTEFGRSDYGYPQRDWFANGRHVATQSMQLDWGERIEC